MRQLDYNEYFICKTLAKIFEDSIDLNNFGSEMFIRRFIFCEESKMYFNKTYIFLSTPPNDTIDYINTHFKSYGSNIKFSKDQMYWIGYMYGALSFLYKLNRKQVYNLFPPKTIVNYYPIYHTFGVEQAAERIIENIKYKEINYNKIGLRVLKELNK